MARQVGILRHKGSYGTLRNYKVSGQNYITVAGKGGPSKEQVDNLPSMVVCRKFNIEFAGCQLAVHSIDSCLKSFDSRLFDTLLTGREVQIVKKIIKTDEQGTFGKRAIAFSVNRPTLKNLVLNPAKKLASAFTGSVLFEHPIGRNSATLTIEADHILDIFPFGKNENRVQVSNCLFCLSDFTYSEINGIYEPLSPLNEFKAPAGKSEVLSTSGNPAVDLEVVTTMPEGLVFPEEISLVQVMIVEFGFNSGEQFIKTGHFGLKIVDVF